MNPSTPVPPRDEAIAATRTWIERAVIGLNLCPCAKAVHVNGQIRYVVSEAQTSVALLDDLVRELRVLAEAAPKEIETLYTPTNGGPVPNAPSLTCLGAVCRSLKSSCAVMTGENVRKLGRSWHDSALSDAVSCHDQTGGRSDEPAVADPGGGVPTACVVLIPVKPAKDVKHIVGR
jgi:Protein of unknown function (DUF1415)